MKIAKISKLGYIGLLALVGGLYTTDHASAKAGCSEGRTRTGKCIQPVIAAVQRKIMVAFTQPKISQSSKLISTVAAPAQIMASVQNINIAQASTSTFENLRGPSSYEAQPHYNTTVAPSSYSNNLYLTYNEFIAIRSNMLSHVTAPFSPLSLEAQKYWNISPWFIAPSNTGPIPVDYTSHIRKL